MNLYRGLEVIEYTYKKGLLDSNKSGNQSQSLAIIQSRHIRCIPDEPFHVELAHNIKQRRLVHGHLGRAPMTCIVIIVYPKLSSGNVLDDRDRGKVSNSYTGTSINTTNGETSQIGQTIYCTWKAGCHEWEVPLSPSDWRTSTSLLKS